ncbi:ABC transporter ATP-binding protein [uncultured Croceitalea sp.]|uniref:ABC transporter ATP-binding protein n=1 Tax=uncultured Croceitalea sp. TaxID=1798908 RepID=UPI003305822C
MDKLSITNLSKTYDNGVKALDAISLEISKGMFGLLGPNGAGKSTLMRTLATLQEPDEGTVTLGSYNVLRQKDDVRTILGYLPQQFGLYPRVSAETLLNHLAVLKGITHKKERKEIVKALLQKTNLYDVRRQNLGGFSGGMKQRFGIAQALLNNPKLLIVDEPTAGLDPAERNRFYNLLSELGENTVVILSTHIVDDVKELCTDMAIINKGKVLKKGNPLKLIAQLEGKVYQKTIQKNELATYKRLYNVISVKFFQGEPIIHIICDEHPNNDFISIKADLEHVYFSQIHYNSQLT